MNYLILIQTMKFIYMRQRDQLSVENIKPRKTSNSIDGWLFTFWTYMREFFFFFFFPWEKAM